MTKKTKIFIIILLLLVIILGAAGNYFYNYAVVPAKKDFLASDDHKSTQLVQAEKWFKNKNNRIYWHQRSKDGLKLSAIYLPAETTSNKTVIVAHGYMGNAEDMAQYADLFHQLGYNVLVPDARGHGRSQGDYIGFGWDERKDYLGWIKQILHQNPTEQIVLDGVSMGAATVMMTSGEKLPANVKAVIEDCGYSSVTAELTYQLKQMFNLPAFPLINVTSLVTKLRAGYFFGDADTLKQLHQNKTPILFIHGDKDDFVPYSMLAKVYAATDAPKEKYIVKGAKHAEALTKDPVKYQQTVADFLAHYVK